MYFTLRGDRSRGKYTRIRLRGVPPSVPRRACTRSRISFAIGTFNVPPLCDSSLVISFILFCDLAARPISHPCRDRMRPYAQSFQQPPLRNNVYWSTVYCHTLDFFESKRYEYTLRADIAMYKINVGKIQEKQLETRAVHSIRNAERIKRFAELGYEITSSAHTCPRGDTCYKGRRSLSHWKTQSQIVHATFYISHYFFL